MLVFNDIMTMIENRKLNFDHIGLSKSYYGEFSIFTITLMNDNNASEFILSGMDDADKLFIHINDQWHEKTERHAESANIGDFVLAFYELVTKYNLSKTELDHGLTLYS